MHVVKGDSHTFRCAARSADNFASPLNVKIVSSTGNELAAGQISSSTPFLWVFPQKTPTIIRLPFCTLVNPSSSRFFTVLDRI